MLKASEIQDIAHLARLAIDEADVPTYARDLSRIVELVDQLGAVDTTGVEPMAHPLDVPQRLRPDDVTEADRRDDFQRLAPEVEGGLYLVPRVIE